MWNELPPQRRRPLSARALYFRPIVLTTESTSEQRAAKDACEVRRFDFSLDFTNVFTISIRSSFPLVRIGET